MKIRSLTLTLLLLSFTVGCARTFPRPDLACCGDGLSGEQIFNRSFTKHGGEHLAELNDLNVGLDGKWKFLITRIQPLVTDHKYRVVSQERLLPNLGVYAAFYTGPAGTKKVVRTRDKVAVFYNDKRSLDDDVLQSTALTADAFFIFLLGPLSLERLAGNFQRLPDTFENDKRYFRIYAQMQPGIGFSSRDEIVLWIDAESFLTYRVHITLEGYATTKGAHVDVTFLEYQGIDRYTFPSKFHERVRGPIAIDAHSWHLTGIDINRGLALEDVDSDGWSVVAGDNAKRLE